MNTTTMYCHVCDDDRDFRPEVRAETHNVRGEQVTADIHVLTCPACGDTQPHPDHDFMVPLYNAYRQKHGMLMPEEIKDIREKYGLSREAFAALLGMSPASLYRYERGALQDDVHDELIRCCQDPTHMRDLMRRRGDRLGDLPRRRFAEAVANLAHPTYTLTWTELTELADELTGHRRFDYFRYSYMVRTMCAIVGGAFTTKLNKLLFYADFLAFKARGESISGSPYRAIQHGPVPADYGALLDRLANDEFIELEEVDFDDHSGARVRPGPRLPQMAPLDPTEQRIIEYVAKHFHQLSSRRIRDVSHEESAWRETEPKSLINYAAHAPRLSIDLPPEDAGRRQAMG